jgi:hypothetical protein
MGSLESAYHASAAAARRLVAAEAARISAVKVALAQHNPTIGDFEGNLRVMLDSLARAEHAGAVLMVTSELGIAGYPPRDLVERPA